MKTLIALLRAVNVGGTGKLPMAELRALCEAVGFHRVRTYIQSGNVVFGSPLAPAAARGKLEKALSIRLGKPGRVFVRTVDEMESAIARNPFPEAAPNRLIVVFYDEPLPAGALDGWKTPGGERLSLSGRELFVHFPDGIGSSKMVLPFAGIGTGRNLNTVRKLVEMARSSV